MVLTGRGGYGNYIPRSKLSPQVGPSTDLEPVPSTPAPVQHFTSPKQTFRAGRGGYGNNLPVSVMATMTPTEYLQEIHDAVDVEPARYSVGRGGSGNIIKKETTPRSVKNTSNLAPVASTPVSIGNESGLWHKLKTTLSN